MDKRDWATNPPISMDEGVQLATELANAACDYAQSIFGERPHVERRGNSLFVVWPDGEVTNEISIEFKPLH